MAARTAPTIAASVAARCLEQCDIDARFGQARELTVAELVNPQPTRRVREDLGGTSVRQPSGSPDQGHLGPRPA
jgi:hypothetical protein